MNTKYTLWVLLLIAPLSVLHAATMSTGADGSGSAQMSNGSQGSQQSSDGGDSVSSNGTSQDSSATDETNADNSDTEGAGGSFNPADMAKGYFPGGIKMTDAGISVPGVEISADGSIKVGDNIEVGSDFIKTPGVTISGNRMELPGGVVIETGHLKTPVVEITDDQITVGGGQIIVGVGGTQINTPEATTTVGGDEVSLASAGKEIAMNSGGYTASTTETMKLVGGKVSLLGANKQPIDIGISPEQAATTLGLSQDEVNSMGLGVASGSPVYQVQGSDKKKFLGLFNITVPTAAALNAQTGSIISKNSPWWGWLAF